MADQSQRRSPWLVKCIWCGKPVQKRNRMARSYCSDECSRARKKWLSKFKPVPKCEICGQEFTKSSGRQRFCLRCRGEARRKYIRDHYAANRDQVRKGIYAYRARTGYAKKYREANREKQRVCDRRRRENPVERLYDIFSGAVRFSLRSNKNGCAWEGLVGYTCEQLKAHLERQFVKGMSWETWGRGPGKWHIDHILPRKLFNFQSADDPEFKACWALSNLRPMWGAENIRKHARREHLI